MNLIDFTKIGGYRFKQASLRKMQESYFFVLRALISFLQVPDTGNYIISGCTIDGANITSGLLYIDGELCPFTSAAGTLASKIKKNVEITTLSFKNGVNEPVFRKTTAIIDPSGAELSAFNRVGSIPTIPAAIVLDPNFPPTVEAPSLIDRILKLEVMSAPFHTGNVSVLWNRRASEIPDGWVEDVDWRGRFPVGMDITVDGGGVAVNPEFSPLAGGMPGRTGGAKTKTLAANNLPDFTISINPTAGDDSGGGSLTSGTPGEGPLDINYVGGKVPFSILDPFRTVLFIKMITA